MATLKVLDLESAPLSADTLPLRTYHLAGAISRAMLAGIEPTEEWVNARHWQIDVMDHASVNEGQRIDIPAYTLDRAEIIAAIQRAEHWLANA